MRKLIYTIICFKCILQITEGSPYQKYINLFARLLILCMCCNMIFSQIENMKSVYTDFMTQWDVITDSDIDENDIKAGSEYYEEKLMEALDYESVTGESEVSDRDGD